jgi:hypothetical protein
MLKVFYILILLISVLFVTGCPAKPLPEYKKGILKHIAQMKKIKKAIFKEIQDKPDIDSLNEIISAINNSYGEDILMNEIDGEEYVINPDINIWKNFVLKKKVEGVIAIYCKTNLYPKSTGYKYFAGTLGTKYYPLRKPPFPATVITQSGKEK